MVHIKHVFTRLSNKRNVMQNAKNMSLGSHLTVTRCICKCQLIVLQVIRENN